jgi:PEP-CTERM motif
MKNSFKILFLSAIILMGMSMVASATVVNCANATPTQISTGFSCYLGDLTFNFTSVSVIPTGADYLIDPSTGVYATSTGDDVVLDIDVDSAGLAGGGTVDSNITYTVTSTSANVAGVDNSFGGGSGSITEVVCSTPLVYGTNCSSQNTTLANFTNYTGVNDTVMFPNGPTSPVYIYKDAEGTFSSFTDSIVETSSVPEPSSFWFLGAALLGLAVFGRKLRFQ